MIKFINELYHTPPPVKYIDIICEKFSEHILRNNKPNCFYAIILSYMSLRLNGVMLIFPVFMFPFNKCIDSLKRKKTIAVLHAIVFCGKLSFAAF